LPAVITFAPGEVPHTARMIRRPTDIDVDLVYPLYQELRSLVTVRPSVIAEHDAAELFTSGTAAQQLQMPWVWGCLVNGELHAQLNRARLLTRVLRDAPAGVHDQPLAYAELLFHLLSEDVRGYLASFEEPLEPEPAALPAHDPAAQARLHQLTHGTVVSAREIYRFAFKRAIH